MRHVGGGVGGRHPLVGRAGIPLRVERTSSEELAWAAERANTSDGGVCGDGVVSQWSNVVLCWVLFA